MAKALQAKALRLYLLDLFAELDVRFEAKFFKPWKNL